MVSLLQRAGVSKVAAALLTAVRQAVKGGCDATDAALALLQLVTHLCSLDFSEALVSGEQVLSLCCTCASYACSVDALTMRCLHTCAATVY